MPNLPEHEHLVAVHHLVSGRSQLIAVDDAGFDIVDRLIGASACGATETVGILRDLEGRRWLLWSSECSPGSSCFCRLVGAHARELHPAGTYPLGVYTEVPDRITRELALVSIRFVLELGDGTLLDEVPAVSYVRNALAILRVADDDLAHEVARQIESAEGRLGRNLL